MAVQSDSPAIDRERRMSLDDLVAAMWTSIRIRHGAIDQIEKARDAFVPDQMGFRAGHDASTV
ncbi:hypothetical protein WL15_18500 [Burkholderia multivorans]|nr:hypothetical protein WL15_18500 [Burkholderia multivorans]